MTLLFALAFALAAQPAPLSSAPATPDADTDARIACTATFAIVAAQQQAGAPEFLAFPLVTERGRRFAGLVGERAIAAGATREAVRDAMVAAVAEQQRGAQDAAADTGDSDAFMEAAVARCLPMLDRLVPRDTVPTLEQCAALLGLAYDRVYRDEGLTPKARDLKTLAFVLDSRARDAMRARGLSGTERDAALVAVREDVRAAEEAGSAPAYDIDHCFALAAPEDKAPRPH